MSLVDTIAKAKAWDNAQQGQQEAAVQSAFTQGEQSGVNKLTAWLASNQNQMLETPQPDSAYRPYDSGNAAQQQFKVNKPAWNNVESGMADKFANDAEYENYLRQERQRQQLYNQM